VGFCDGGAGRERWSCGEGRESGFGVGFVGGQNVCCGGSGIEGSGRGDGEAVGRERGMRVPWRV